MRHARQLLGARRDRRAPTRFHRTNRVRAVGPLHTNRLSQAPSPALRDNVMTEKAARIWGGTCVKTSNMAAELMFRPDPTLVQMIDNVPRRPALLRLSRGLRLANLEANALLLFLTDS